ncbi:hypothetical protein LWI28_009229 [Acer negundo]|uniref:Retrovirus-related Pol polyprotein from transposon TNT 1-94-like beta-barrel domain-containing protein n=1 Tax=Acer negundo TaxID=4023 RepID=A0AAD5JG65_ACENE|nr:hypothetical protein LWI28_009229 [Acer negundo]
MSSTGDKDPETAASPESVIRKETSSSEKKVSSNKRVSSSSVVKTDGSTRDLSSSLLGNQKMTSHAGNPLGSYCSVKLNHENYLLWKNLVLLVIHGNRMEGYITGAKKCPPEYIITNLEQEDDKTLEENPEYEDWIVHDQILLGWLYNSMEPDVASEVIKNETSKDLWESINTLFGLKTKSNIAYYKREFQKLQKGGMKMSNYLKAVKKLADNLALASRPMPLEDLVSQVLDGFDSVEYNPLVCQINEKEEINWIDLQAKLLSYEKRLEQINAGLSLINLGQVSTNNAGTKNTGGQFTKFVEELDTLQSNATIGYNDAYQGTPPDLNKGNNNSNPNLAYVASSKTVNDPAWYADSGASCHVTNDTGHIGQRTEYNGKQTLIVGNGDKLSIVHIRDSLMHTHNNRTLLLKDMLHVPDIKKNLLSISQLIACDNIIVEFDSCGCVVKDKATGVALLQGKLKEGLYQLDFPTNKFVFSAPNSPAYKLSYQSHNKSSYQSQFPNQSSNCNSAQVISSPNKSPSIPYSSSTVTNQPSASPRAISSSVDSSIVQSQESIRQLSTSGRMFVEGEEDIENLEVIEESAQRVYDEHRDETPVDIETNIETNQEQGHQMVTRAKLGIHKPKRYPSEYQMYTVGKSNVPIEPNAYLEGSRGATGRVLSSLGARTTGVSRISVAIEINMLARCA